MSPASLSMKIKMLTSMAGLDFSLGYGEETERFPEPEALRLIASGYAVPVVEQVIERAVVRKVIERRKK